MKYRVGFPARLRDDDPWIEDEFRAIHHARTIHLATDSREPVAVWDEDDEMIWLFFQGEQFMRA